MCAAATSKWPSVCVVRMGAASTDSELIDAEPGNSSSGRLTRPNSVAGALRYSRYINVCTNYVHVFFFLRKGDYIQRRRTPSHMELVSCKKHHLRRGGSGQWSCISRRLAPSSSCSGSGHPHRRQADPSPADHKPAPGSSSHSFNPPHTYISSPTPTKEETAAHRQRARGQDSQNTRTSSSLRRPRRETSTDPSSVRAAPTRGSRV